MTHDERITANLRAGRHPFDGFTDEERIDYAETVRIIREAERDAERAQTEAAPVEEAPSRPQHVGPVDVTYETCNGVVLRFSRAIRVF